MARPKGSKNAVRTKKTNVDYAAIVAEKTTAKEQIETEIAALSDNISVLKEQLKSKKSALKVAAKELSQVMLILLFDLFQRLMFMATVLYVLVNLLWSLSISQGQLLGALTFLMGPIPYRSIT